MSDTKEPNVINATVRVSDADYIPIECRFDDGQKFEAVQVEQGFEGLAERIARYLSAPAAVNDILIGKTFTPRDPNEPLPLRETPYTREELDQWRAYLGPLHRYAGRYAAAEQHRDLRRFLATIEQRDRILLYAIQTDADPAGTYRELVELRDQNAQLQALIAEMKAE